MALGAREHKTRLTIVGDDKTARAFRSVGTGLDGMQKKFSGIALGAGLGAAAIGGLVAGLVIMTRRSIESADAIGKVADKVGLGVESLQELRFAAEQTGVAQGTLDMAMQRFSRRVGEAVQGQGELVKTLDQYGIAVTDAEGRTRTLDAVMNDYADAIQNAGSNQEQLRLAFKGFDSEGAALVNLLRGGSAGLDEMRQKARELGLVLDGDMVRNAEAANDAMSRMEQIVGVNLQKILISFAPVIEDIGLAFAKAAPAIQRFAENFASVILGVDITSLQTMNFELGEVVDKIAELNATPFSPGFTPADQKRVIAGLQAERAEIEANIAARQKELDQRRALFDFGNSGGAGGATDTRTDKELAAGQRLADGILATNLRLNDNHLALLEIRHEREMEAIENSALVEQEKFDARVLAEENFEIRRREIADEAAEAERTAFEKRFADLEKITGISAKAIAAKWKQGLSGQLSATKSVLGAIVNLQGGESKKMFKATQALAIADALVNTYKGAQAAYAAFAFFPPLAATMAALATGVGLANVASIKSQKFGGGSSGGGGSTGGGVPAIPTPADIPSLAPEPAVPATRVIDVHIESDQGVVSTAWIRDQLFPGLNEALGDGLRLNVA